MVGEVAGERGDAGGVQRPGGTRPGRASPADPGVGAGVLIATGGLLYTIGAVVYARQRPDPSPTVFGYHEIFHVLTVIGYTCHLVAVFIATLGAR